MAPIEFAQTSGMILAAFGVAFLARRLAPTTIISLGLGVIGVCIGLVAGISAVWQVVLVLLASAWRSPAAGDGADRRPDRGG